MVRNQIRFRSPISRTIAAAVACISAGCILAGCGGSPPVDKYTVTDADRAAAKGPVGADGQPLKGSSSAIPRDPNDGAAYGPDGKRIGGAGSSAPPPSP